MTVTAVLPALPLQEAIWQHRQLSDPGAALYVSQRVLRVTPRLDFSTVEQAWTGLHRAHEALRSRLLETRGRLVQVVTDEPLDLLLEILDVEALTTARRRALLDDLRGRHTNRLAAGPTPAVGLGMLQGAAESTVVLTWKHELLDGTGITRLLTDLKNAQEGVAVSGTSLVEAMRLLLDARPIELKNDALGRPPPQLSSFMARAPTPGLVRRLPLDWASLVGHARARRNTPASFAVAAWLGALTEVTKRSAFVLTVEDTRPESARGVPGMFAGVGAAWWPQGVTSLQEARSLLLRHRSTSVGRRPVSVSELLRPAWDAGSVGIPDVLLTVHPGEASTPVTHRWVDVDAIERTEFALNVDLVGGDKAELVVHLDPARVDESTVADLLNRTVQNLTVDDMRLAGPPPQRVAPEQCSPIDDGRTAVAVAACRRIIVGRRVGPDTDLVATGIDSFTMMRLAAELTEAGLPVPVNVIFAERTPRRVANAARQAGRASNEANTSPIERALLARTTRHHLGRAPMHEQSVIVVRRTLDPHYLLEALRHVGSQCEIPCLRWVDDSLQDDGGGAIVFESELAARDEDVPLRARAILADDLERGFERGDVLFRTWLVQGPRNAALAMAWHNAVLDGWSHATLIRFLRDSYEAVRIGRVLPPTPGAHIAAFRSWCAQQADSSRWWRDALESAVWAGRPTQRLGCERDVSIPRVICDTADLAALVGPATTPIVSAITLAAHALADATGADSRSPVGVRIGLRPAEVVGSLRMIGQATLEAPILFSPANGPRDAVATSSRIADAREHGHVGEISIRLATSCPDDQDLFDLLVVPETELADDEWAIRAGDVHGWPEVTTWRREVSPSRHTVYVHLDEGVILFRISTVMPSAEAMADQVQHAASRILESWARHPVR